MFLFIQKDGGINMYEEPNLQILYLRETDVVRTSFDMEWSDGNVDNDDWT